VSAEKPRIEVAIALVWRDGRLLVTRRPTGVHLAGRSEFPGGKLHLGESPEACAEREVLEETGVRARARARRDIIEWDYPERKVLLHPVDCDWLAGDGEALEVSDVRWVVPAELSTLDFPEANAALVAALAGIPAAGIPRG
jgi:mutator protein MutT